MNTSTEVLIRPTTRVFCSYRAAVAEYQAEGKYPDFDGLELSTLENMEHHVKQVRAEWGGPNAHLWWFVSGNEYWEGFLCGPLKRPFPPRDSSATTSVPGFEDVDMLRTWSKPFFPWRPSWA